GRDCRTVINGSNNNIVWDKDGNRTDTNASSAEATCLASGSSSGTHASYTYNQDDSLKTAAGKTVVYDAAGRMTSDGTNSYCYDGFDRQSVYTAGAATNNSCSTSATNTTTYAYDGLNRQVHSATNATGITGPSSHDYGYDQLGSDQISDSGNQSDSGDITYIRSGDNQPLAVGKGGSISQYLTQDGRGDIGTVTASGSPTTNK